MTREQGQRMRLRAEVGVSVLVSDDTEFGSPLTPAPDENTRRLFRSLVRWVEERGVDGLLECGPHLLGEAVSDGALAAVADEVSDAGWKLRDEILYPDVSRARPVGIAARDGGGNELVGDVRPDEWSSLHGLIAGLSAPGGLDVAQLGLDGAGSWYDRMARARLVERCANAPGRGDDSLSEPGITFVGHNTVVVRSRSVSLIVDPLILPTRDRRSSYRPLDMAELGALDAVVITHSHPDHFSLGSLLQVPADTLVVVPEVERETLLAVAMADRLREIGFTRVVELRWGDHVVIGDVEVHALPFLGEQPTDGVVLHREVRNAGNVYVVRTPEFSVALLADSGRDGLGDVRDVAVQARERLGPVDVVFSGYRGWHAYPVQHVFSSVARYLLFVPPALWGSRMQLMNDVEDALDVAERWGARVLVPYADGGAPWYWERGLGPRLDEARYEIAGVDPFPERVVDAAKHRIQTPDGGWLGSPVTVRVLRPNESLVEFASGGGPQWRQLPLNSWPFSSEG
jgi:L-ascorbate metabolism protein UlaG (beta-lactamase superfamily)